MIRNRKKSYLELYLFLSSSVKILQWYCANISIEVQTTNGLASMCISYLNLQVIYQTDHGSNYRVYYKTVKENDALPIGVRITVSILEISRQIEHRTEQLSSINCTWHWLKTWFQSDCITCVSLTFIDRKKPNWSVNCQVALIFVY